MEYLEPYGIALLELHFLHFLFMRAISLIMIAMTPKPIIPSGINPSRTTSTQS